MFQRDGVLTYNIEIICKYQQAATTTVDSLRKGTTKIRVL